MPHSSLLLCFAVLILSLACAACASDTPETSMTAENDMPADSASTLIYVGTASSDSTEGIYALRFDSATGALSEIGNVTQVLNPSFLAHAPETQTLYAVSESSGMGSVLAYRVDAATGGLTLLNQQSTGGTGPAYVSVDHTGGWVLVANYGGGSVALLPIDADGRLGAATDVVQHEGSGPDAERQEAPHAHFIRTSPDNRYAYAADLGIDRVRIYTLDAENGSLTTAAVQEAETAPGAGPRHLDFHPNGRYVYLMNELDAIVTAFSYDPETGNLTPIQTLSTLPDDFEGYNKSADIHVHPSGRWLYASNRGDFDSIAIFAIDETTGQLTAAGHQSEDIHWPRNFAIDPSGRYLLVANRQANEVHVFEINVETGQLTTTDHSADVPEPTNVTFFN